MELQIAPRKFSNTQNNIRKELISHQRILKEQDSIREK
jgi:hypothetical protein